MNNLIQLIAEGEGGKTGGNQWVMLVILGVLLIVMFVMPIFTNKKRNKQVNDMRTTLRVGDEIMTIGGIVGTVIEIREINAVDKDFVIETGTGEHKSTMVFDIRALHENRTRTKEIQEEMARQQEQQRLAAEAKKREAEAKKAAKHGQPAPEVKEEAPAEKPVEAENNAESGDKAE